MRVLHLSTSAVGGAAIAGQRIHAALRSAGVDSVFASRGPSTGLPGEVVLPLSRADMLRSSATTAAAQALAQHAQSAFTPISGGFIDRGWLRDMAPEVLVVHNWFNLLGTSYRGMLGDIDVPVCFVLHDERLFTGGCHYAEPCRQFETECSRCPQARPIARPLVHREQQRMHDRLRGRRISVVTPSRWLADEAARSATLRDLDIAHIPNPIDTKVFHSGLRDAARQEAGIGADDLVLAWQPGKGDEMLAPVLHLVQAGLPSGAQLKLLRTGKSPGSAVLPTIAVGTLTTEAERARFWAAADVGFSLTSFDNFPNIVLEAMACGVPFVMPDVGGAGEAVRKIGGGVVAPRTAEAIADAVLQLLAYPERGRALLDAGLRELRALYSPDAVAMQYAQLLDELCAR